MVGMLETIAIVGMRGDQNETIVGMMITIHGEMEGMILTDPWINDPGRPCLLHHHKLHHLRNPLVLQITPRRGLSAVLVLNCAERNQLTHQLLVGTMLLEEMHLIELQHVAEMMLHHLGILKRRYQIGKT